MQLASFADLYGGKIVAALDRQHPRDLFDIKELLVNEGIDDDLRRAFVVYLISHNRPLHEVIAPNRKDITREYERGFAGKTDALVPLDDLLATREVLVETMIRHMPSEQRSFLISFVRGEPDWALLGLEHVSNLPAIKWRQLNLDKLGDEPRAALVSNLESALDT